MSLPCPDALDKKMNEAKSLTEFNLHKITALKALSDLIGCYNKRSNPYLNGDVPYDVELIKVLFNRIHSNIPIDCFYATQLMLDYYFPDWKDHASDNVIGLTIDRSDPEVRKWRKSVMIRDKFECKKCSSKNNLHAHHIIHWADSPALRTKIDNGVTLCSQCHSYEHKELSDKLFKQHDR